MQLENAEIHLWGEWHRAAQPSELPFGSGSRRLLTLRSRNKVRTDQGASTVKVMRPLIHFSW